MAEFYQNYELIDEAAAHSQKLKSTAIELGDAIVLFWAAPKHLYRRQLGYRWVGMEAPYQESATWNRDLVVVAVFNDDPQLKGYRKERFVEEIREQLIAGTSPVDSTRGCPNSVPMT